MVLVNNDIDSEREIYWETNETITSFDLEPKKEGYSQVKEVNEISMILGSPVKDKDYEINDKHMRKTWDKCLINN